MSSTAVCHAWSWSQHLRPGPKQTLLHPRHPQDRRLILRQFALRPVFQTVESVRWPLREIKSDYSSGGRCEPLSVARLKVLIKDQLGPANAHGHGRWRVFNFDSLSTLCLKATNLQLVGLLRNGMLIRLQRLHDLCLNFSILLQYLPVGGQCHCRSRRPNHRPRNSSLPRANSSRPSTSRTEGTPWSTIISLSRTTFSLDCQMCGSSASPTTSYLATSSSRPSAPSPLPW